MMLYIYTLVVESQNPSSIPASFLIRNAKKEICGLLVARGGQELLTATSVTVHLYQGLISIQDKVATPVSIVTSIRPAIFECECK